MDVVGNMLGEEYDEEMGLLYEDLAYAKKTKDRSMLRRVRGRLGGLR